ncbi:swr1 complex component [Tulasnella sp. 332]|nr:swr1 complex component [Tulasnella sp. 332]
MSLKASREKEHGEMTSSLGSARNDFIQNGCWPVDDIMEKATLLNAKRAELSVIMYRHDDLVREAFHLDKFVTLVEFDPQIAKQDKSVAFEEFHDTYDLFQSTALENSTLTRQTRSAGRRSLLAVAEAPTCSMRSIPSRVPSPAKARSSLRFSTVPASASVNETQVIEKAKATPSRLAKVLSQANQRIVTGARGHSTRQGSSVDSSEATSTSRASSTLTELSSGDVSPSRAKILHVGTAVGCIKSIIYRSLSTNIRSLIQQTVINDISVTMQASEESRKPNKRKASEALFQVPRSFKRTRVFCRPSIPEYSHPRQIPPSATHHSSLTALLGSVIYIDDKRSIPADNTHDLDVIVEKEARKRGQIEKARAAGAFVHQELKMNATPPKEFTRRRVDHWGHVLSRVIQVHQVMREARKSRLAGACLVSKIVEKHFEELIDAENRRRRSEEQHKLALAKRTMREVVKQWKLVIRVVRARKRREPEAEQIQENHLDIFLKTWSHTLEVHPLDPAPMNMIERCWDPHVYSVPRSLEPFSGDDATHVLPVVPTRKPAPSADKNINDVMDCRYGAQARKFAITSTMTPFAMSRSIIADFEIQELLVRRRLLETETRGCINFEVVGFLVTCVDPPSSHAMHSTRQLDASVQLLHQMAATVHPPSLDARTISGWKSLRAHQQRCNRAERWKHKAIVNHSRCQKQFVYSADVLRATGTITKDLFSSSRAGEDGRSSWRTLDARSRVVRSCQETQQSIPSTITRFHRVMPRAIASDVVHICILQESGPTGSDTQIAAATLEGGNEEDADDANVGLIDEYLLRAVQRDWEYYAALVLR